MLPYDLLKVYHSLEGGIAFNPKAQVATFTNLESCRKFKAAAQDWTILFAAEYRNGRNGKESRNVR
jgi:hypothetical protein